MSENEITSQKQTPKRKVASRPKGPRLVRFVHIDATERLPVRLTDTEVAQKGMIYARLNNEREAKIAERKSVMDRYKAEISAITEEMEEVGHMLLSREEERLIPIRVTFDNKNRTKTRRRRDNRQVIGSVEPMTSGEIKLHAAPPLIDVPPAAAATAVPSAQLVPPTSHSEMREPGPELHAIPTTTDSPSLRPAAKKTRAQKVKAPVSVSEGTDPIKGAKDGALESVPNNQESASAGDKPALFELPGQPGFRQDS